MLLQKSRPEFLRRAGANFFAIADRRGWKRLDTVRGFHWNAKLFKNHAGASIL
jgi:hypothetical protein